MLAPGGEQKTGQRDPEIVRILPATLLVKRNLDLQLEPRSRTDARQALGLSEAIILIATLR